MIIAVRSNYELAAELAQKIAEERNVSVAIKKCIYGKNKQQIEYHLCDASDITTQNSLFYCQTFSPKPKPIKLI